MNSKVIAVMAGVFASIVFAAAQDADTLQPGPEGKDSYVNEGFPGQNYGDQVDLWIGITGGDFRRSFIEFDLLPYAGRLLDSCFLDLWCYKREKTVGATDTTGVWRVTQLWQENTITWNNQPGTDPAMFSSYADGDKDTWWTWDVKDMVQEWLDGTFPNNGFIIVFYFLGINSNATFYSSDAPAPNPRLRLYFKVQKSITVTAPNGFENWQAGTNHYITWTSTGSIPNVKIEYTSDYTTTWKVLSYSSPNTGSVLWTVPNEPTDGAAVRISDAVDPLIWDWSDHYFSILPPAAIADHTRGETNRFSLMIQGYLLAQPVIRYQIPALTRPSLKIYTVEGREVRDLSLSLTATSGTVVWEGSDDSGRLLPEGIYFCRLQSAEKQSTARIMIIR